MNTDLPDQGFNTPRTVAVLLTAESPSATDPDSYISSKRHRICLKNKNESILVGGRNLLCGHMPTLLKNSLGLIQKNPR